MDMFLKQLRLFFTSTLVMTIMGCGGDSSSSTAECGESLPTPNVYSVALAPNSTGDVYVGGYFTLYNGKSSNFIVRLNSDGSLDRGFSINNGFNGTVFTIAPATDGSGGIYAGGAFTTYNGVSSNHIVRLNSDGSLDSAFMVGSGYSEAFPHIESIVPAADGSGDIYVGGAFSTYNGNPSNHLIRLNSDGSRDTGFAIGAGFDLGSSKPFSGVRSIALATDGSGDIYVGGWFKSYNGSASDRLIRLNSDGSRDNDFVIGNGFDSGVLSVASTNDGSGDIYVGGWFSRYNNHNSPRIIRLNNDGSVDTGFDIGAGFKDGIYSGTIYSIVPVNDGTGTVYVGGNYQQYQGMRVKHLVRLNGDGSTDSGFTFGDEFDDSNGFNHQVRSIALSENGSGNVYVGGLFASYFGVASYRIIRLNNIGSRDASFVVGSGISGCRPLNT